MEKEFIPYEQSLALKELGFNELCLGGWDKNNKWWYHPDSDVIMEAPLWQQTFRWFRDKYNLDCMIDRNTKDEYFGNKRYHKLSKEYETITKGFKTYEEAELECLKKLLTLIKKK